MYKIYSILLFIVLSISSFSQIPESQEGYVIDTVYSPSAEDSSILDTLIVYRKSNIVRKQVFVEDTSTLPVTTRLWSYVIHTSMLFPQDDTLHAALLDGNTWQKQGGTYQFDLGIQRQFKHFSIGATVGLNYTSAYVYSIQERQITTEEKTTYTDTLEYYYIENELGKHVFAFTEQRDTTILHTAYSGEKDSSSIKSLQARIGIEATVRLFSYKNTSLHWRLWTGILVPLNIKGRTISNDSTWVNTSDVILKCKPLVETGLCIRQQFKEIALEANVQLTQDKGLYLDDLFSRNKEAIRIQLGISVLF